MHAALQLASGKPETMTSHAHIGQPRVHTCTVHIERWLSVSNFDQEPEILHLNQLWPYSNFGFRHKYAASIFGSNVIRTAVGINDLYLLVLRFIVCSILRQWINTIFPFQHWISQGNKTKMNDYDCNFSKNVTLLFKMCSKYFVQFCSVWKLDHR